MPRSRNIKPGFFTNDCLAELSPLARLLFIALWCLADREGRLEDRPKRIKVESLPYDDCDVDELLNALDKSGFILRYAVGEDRYIQVINFGKHQSPHHKERESMIPAPVQPETDHRLNLDKPETSLGQALEKPETSRSDSGYLIPDTLNLIPDTQCQGADAGDCSLVMDEYNRIFGEFWKKPLSLTDGRRKQIRNRLGKYSVDDLIAAMKNLRLSDFHCGKNDSHTFYAKPEFIFRSDDKVDEWLKKALPQTQPIRRRGVERV